MGIEDVDVCAEMPDLASGDETERFGRYSVGAAEGGFEGSGEGCFDVGLPARGRWDDLVMFP